jgi:hypothetical protein
MRDLFLLPAMRTARIKVPPRQSEAVYHCISRTVNGERILDEPAREVLRKQLWLTAEFCGVQVLTYAILSNHFHILVRVPEQMEVPDAELLRRFRLLHPRPTPYQLASIEVIEAELKNGSPEGIAWRQRQLALMGDVSPFMKLLKQRFSIWFNRTHNRFGTLWSERFKSLLLESKRGRAVSTVAAYIDLNSVRAGLATDPKDYRFCGYAEAVAGGESARAGLQRIIGGREGADWDATQAAYRETLFGKGSTPKQNAAALTPAQLEHVVKTHGRLSLPEILRCRVRYFSDGAVLGSEAFVMEQLAKYRERFGRRRTTPPRRLPDVADWSDAPLATLRGLRTAAVGNATL